jgi:hypothetical protein
MMTNVKAYLVLPLLVILPWLAAPASAGDAFFKGGVILHPRDVGFEGRWRVAFGSDYPVNFQETLFAGFELQGSAFRQDVVGGGTATIAPANALANVKYKSSSLGARPFAGGGVGLVGSFLFVSGETEWVKEFGFHLLGGVELGRLVLELQLTRAFESGSDTEYTAYVGFVW